MTCIVAIKEDEKIIFGSDTCFSTDEHLYPISIEKIFKIEGELFGVCGDIKVLNAVRSLFTFPPREKQKLLEYTLITIPSAVKDIMDIAGCTKVSVGSEEAGQDFFDGSVMFTYQGKIYVVESNFGCWTSKEIYNSIGSGSDYAMGALTALHKFKIAPRERLKIALGVSAKHTNSVSPPFKFISKGV